MPGRRTHKAVGAITGTAYAFYRGRGQSEGNRILEGFGGGVGGAVGGMLPDLLEPALTPNHRGLAHSVLVGAGIVSAQLDQWSEWCRQKADHYRALQDSTQSDPAKRFLWCLVKMLLRIAAGFLAGVQAGYASHLALDALTPKSLPLVI